MSIGLSLISKKGAAVASDGIRMSPRGEAEDDFDKTFSLDDPRIIGIHVGLTDFQGATNAQHIKDIIVQNSSVCMNDVVATVASKLSERLESSGITALDRRVELILVGRKDLSLGEFEIHTIDFKPAPNGKIAVTSARYKDAGAYAHSGDDQARAAAKEVIEAAQTKRSALRVRKLKELAERAIRAGVKHCGPHPNFPDQPACAGGPYTKVLYYS